MNYIFFILLSASAVLFLSYNIYKTVNRAEANYTVRQQEQEKRDELLSELDDVNERVAYLQSKDARRNMAVEGFRMAAPGESLYEIDEGEVEAVYIDQEEIEPVNLEDNKFWWEFITLGIK